jgi:5'(3')-deoxyribonucleotidase
VSLTRHRRFKLGARPRVLVDVDEVLGDFQGPALDIMSEVTGRQYIPEDFEVWDIFSILTEEEREAVFERIEVPGFCSGIEPKEGAIKAIKEIQTFADVYPVTSPFHSKPWVVERTQWLGDRFGWKKSEIVFTSAKFLVGGDALIDDRPENVIKWGEHHPDGLPILWHLPNTRNMPHDDIRATTWAEVIEKLKSHAERNP